MKLNLELLKQLSEVAGIPGWEDRVRELVLTELNGLVDEIRVDALGNVIAHKKVRAKKSCSQSTWMKSVFTLNT